MLPAVLIILFILSYPLIYICKKIMDRTEDLTPLIYDLFDAFKKENLRNTIITIICFIIAFILFILFDLYVLKF